MARVLKLLYAAHNSYASVAAELTYEYHPKVLQAILESWLRQQSVDYSSIVSRQEDWHQVARETWKVWHQPPYSWRKDVTVQSGDTITFIATESCTYLRGGRYVNVNPPKHTSSWWAEDEIFLDPSLLLAIHEIHVGETDTYLNRQVIRVRSTPRRTRWKLSGVYDIAWLMSGEEYELLIDMEYGVLLRYSARAKGQIYAIVEVKRVEFDVPINSDIFFVPMDGGIG